MFRDMFRRASGQERKARSEKLDQQAQEFRNQFRRLTEEVQRAVETERKKKLDG